MRLICGLFPGLFLYLGSWLVLCECRGVMCASDVQRITCYHSPGTSLPHHPSDSHQQFWTHDNYKTDQWHWILLASHCGKKNRAESQGVIFQYHCAAALFVRIEVVAEPSPSVSSRMVSIDGTRLIIVIFLIQVLSLRIDFLIFWGDFALQGWSPQRTSSEVVVRERKLFSKQIILTRGTFDSNFPPLFNCCCF